MHSWVVIDTSQVYVHTKSFQLGKKILFLQYNKHLDIWGLESLFPFPTHTGFFHILVSPPDAAQPPSQKERFWSGCPSVKAHGTLRLSKVLEKLQMGCPAAVLPLFGTTSFSSFFCFNVSFHRCT